MEWLIEMRKEKKLSQVEVAATLDISQSHYAALENGVRSPSVKLAKKISEFFGFNWTRFFDCAARSVPGDDRESA